MPQKSKTFTAEMPTKKVGNLATARTDIQTIIRDQGITAVLIRQTETTDTMGGVSDVSEKQYNIYALIQDITHKDRQIHEMGLAIPGNAKGFFYHEYSEDITKAGESVVVKAGDIIQDSDYKQWRVEQIVAERKFEGQEVFRTAVLKKIDLNQ